MGRYILALDQGTTSSRAALIQKDGSTAYAAQREFGQFFPSPGWVEHDPGEIWSSIASVLAEVMAKGNIAPSDIAAIGITNQRETTVIWDRATGVPIYPAIVWQDRRTTEYCQLLKGRGLEPLVQRKTGLLLDPYFSGPKIHWILHTIPGALERAKRGDLAFGTIDTWLLWKLTGGKVHATDVTNASRTLLFNLLEKKWDDELLNLFDVPKALLPTVRSSSEIYGTTDPEVTSLEVPISGIAGDQQAALFGQACLTRGMAKITYGTGCFLLVNTGETPTFSKHRLLTTIAYEIGGSTHYALEGSVFMGGAVIQWLRDGLKIVHASSDIEQLATSVPDSGGVAFVPAFTGLGAPHWDPYARGAIVGLSRGTTSAHIARAALEGIAHQVTDVLEAMEKESGLPLAEIRVDGGAAQSGLLMQLQADLTGVPVVRPTVTELTALGAAYLAGLAIKFWSSEAEVAACWKESRRFLPTLPATKVREMRRRWDKALECASVWEGAP
jgi:glycerol kinase